VMDPYETSGSAKDWKILVKMSDYQFLKDSAMAIKKNPVLFQQLECLYVSVSSSPDSINNICSSIF
jgi:hypothetical protein